MTRPAASGVEEIRDCTRDKQQRLFPVMRIACASQGTSFCELRVPSLPGRCRCSGTGWVAATSACGHAFTSMQPPDSASISGFDGTPSSTRKISTGTSGTDVAVSCLLKAVGQWLLRRAGVGMTITVRTVLTRAVASRSHLPHPLATPLLGTSQVTGELQLDHSQQMVQLVVGRCRWSGL